MLIKWVWANEIGDLSPEFRVDKMKIEAMVAIAEQLAGINTQLEKLNEQVKKGERK